MQTNAVREGSSSTWNKNTKDYSCVNIRMAIDKADVAIDVLEAFY